ncbi:MAG: alpha/beta hydrolase [bacterium]|nr:alpha/beta hydrolase [bacterium]
MGSISYEDCQVHYEVHGEGRPLLYLHGWNGTLDGFKANILPRIGAGWQLVLIDLPGCGKSGWAEVSFDGVAKLIRDILVKLDIRSVRLTGFCLGGVFGLDFALRYPQLVRDVYLLDVTIEYPAVLRTLLVPWLGRQTLRFALHTRLGAWMSLRRLLQKQMTYREEFLTGFAANDLDVSVRYMQLAAAYGKLDHCTRVRQHLGCRLAVVIGKKSAPYIRRSANRLLAAAQDGQLYELDGVGHFIVEENPDQLARILTLP